MSSSRRSSRPCEAAVYRDDKALGPLRLPMARQDDFVEQFNRLYGANGIRALPHDSMRQETGSVQGDGNETGTADRRDTLADLEGGAASPIEED